MRINQTSSSQSAPSSRKNHDRLTPRNLSASSADLKSILVPFTSSAVISLLLNCRSTPPVRVRSRNVASVLSLSILKVGLTHIPVEPAGIRRISKTPARVLPDPAPPTNNLNGALLFQKSN